MVNTLCKLSIYSRIICNPHRNDITYFEEKFSKNIFQTSFFIILILLHGISLNLPGKFPWKPLTTITTTRMNKHCLLKYVLWCLMIPKPLRSDLRGLNNIEFIWRKNIQMTISTTSCLGWGWWLSRSSNGHIKTFFRSRVRHIWVSKLSYHWPR